MKHGRLTKKRTATRPLFAHLLKSLFSYHTRIPNMNQIQEASQFQNNASELTLSCLGVSGHNL